MALRMKIEFPPIFAIDQSWHGNSIRQLIQKSYSQEAGVEIYKKHRVKGYVLTTTSGELSPVLAITNQAKLPEEYSEILRVQAFDLADSQEITLEQSRAKWERHPSLSKILKPPIDYNQQHNTVIKSWRGTFTYLEEDSARQVKGLRSPQIGAVHAVQAHWAVHTDAATVVMPTGTGKTETMLSILVAEQCPRVLIIVPTDVLREQIANKFLTLGILKDFGIVKDSALYPIVGILKHRPKGVEEVDYFFEKCNVVVTTMAIAGSCSVELQQRMAHHGSHLFIDEAHHIAAPKWREFKQQFASKPILQFTATPFREDDEPVEGEVVFTYHLKKAQEEGYFKRIQFKPVNEFDPRKKDEAIAAKAVEQLRADYNLGHILMARVSSIPRAEEVFSIYQQYKEFNPVRIHTKLKENERKEIRKQILSRTARIIVCVDMLGEGFDMPELKIAAFHDIRKSLPITLQIAGRFTRARKDLGDPTFIANIADVEVKEEIQKLYTQDTDWNHLLSTASAEAIQEGTDSWEFLKGFEKFPEEIPLQSVRPTMSTVVYKTKCQNWEPDEFSKGLNGFEALDHVYHDTNRSKNTLVVVTAQKASLDWVRTAGIYTWIWELYVLYWDKEQHVLFIHGSSKSGFYKSLAVAVAGEDVEQIRGAQVFRCFSGINRLKLQNVGLLERLARLISYTMRAGSDIELALSEAQKQNTSKSNIFGAGYEDGKRTTVGCLYKGRIWSRRTANLWEFTKWCSAVGRKLLNENIDADDVLKGTLVAEVMVERPKKMPIGIEWPELIYRETEVAFGFRLGTSDPFPLFLTDINLVAPTEAGDLRFELRSNETRIEFIMELFEKAGAKDFRVSQVSSGDAHIIHRHNEQRVVDFFYEYPPIIWFADGSLLEGNSCYTLRKDHEPYPSDAIKAWDWAGINLQKESQGNAKDTASIQHRVIQELKKSPYDVIFDDHDSGEAADIVAIRAQEKALRVELYHCKSSQKATPGVRIEDLYEVCGQAQKSIHWMDRTTELFSHMLRRERRDGDADVVSRFEQGDDAMLQILRDKSRSMELQLHIFIVQPGLSKGNATKDQLQLLSATQNYLMETYKIPFGAVASP